MIKKTPFNYSNDMDRRRQGLDAIAENLLPDVSTDDAGKIVKVSEAGKWTLGDDENTIIEANPDEQPTVDLENLKIGSTVYSVKNPELTTVKSFKLTMSNGGQYNTNKPIIEFYDEAGIKASITSSDYTVECDKTYAGNAGMDQVCSISTPDTPGTFTYTFVNDFNIENYNLIKLTRGGTFLNDIAKNIKLELSADGENYLTIYDETTITWSDAVPYHLISIKDGSESSTILPIVTSSDNGKVLGVVNGVWDKVPYYNKCYTIPVIDREGNFFSMLPLISVGIDTRPTPDNDGYYEADLYFNAPYSRIGGGYELSPSDFDNVIIGLGTQIFAGLNINDGTNNINLRGCGSWNMQAFDSSQKNYLSNIATLLEIINYENYLVDSDKYAMYDCTITHVRNSTFHIKFKVEKITTT